VVPLVQQGELRAVLVLANTDLAGAFTDARLDAVMLITGQLTVSLGNTLLYRLLEARVAERTSALEGANRQLEQLTLTDPLTGLANRRRFSQALTAEGDRARRKGIPLSVAMIDVDHFKGFNDRYGHPAGDECLRQVARIVDRSTRGSTDLACRYGGEEFVLILPGADAVAAAAVAERARAAVAALAIEHAGSVSGVVTVSIGTSSLVPTDTDAVEQLVVRADGALYRAKHNGRDQVCTAPD
jgi:diguanylate cyclase (GGDEF)-like protein